MGADIDDLVGRQMLADRGKVGEIVHGSAPLLKVDAVRVYHGDQNMGGILDRVRGWRKCRQHRTMAT
jgi:hypothetical protein